MEYRINVDNKFAAIQADDDNEVDPIEALLKLQEQLILSKKSTTTSQKSASGAAKKAGAVAVISKNEKNSQKSSIGGQSGKTTGSKTAATVNTTSKPSPPKPTSSKFTDRPQRFGENVQNATSDSRPSFDSWGGEPKPERDETSNRGRGGFRRGTGFGRNARGGHEGVDRFGKREFDRHSGSDKSGYKPHEKREGAGAHNWGSVKDDIADHMNNTSVTDHNDTSRSDPTEESTSPDQQVVDAEAEAKREEEERQLTLDEWKKLEEEKRVRSQFNIRKPNEGCSDPKWNKMYILKKKDEEEEEEEEDDEDEGYDEKTKQKNVVPIRITFNDGRRGNRGRGGRGGAGGPRRPEGVDVEKKRGPREAPAPNVDDEKDFPSLS